jgi:hypothetical protein
VRAGQRDRLLKLRFDGPDDELQRMSTISSESLEEAERVRVAHTSRTPPARGFRTPSRSRGGRRVRGGGLGLVLCGGRGNRSPVLAASCVAALAIASRVSFDVGAGFTVPTQIAFVPMLLSLPPYLVPPLTVLALGLGLARMSWPAACPRVDSPWYRGTAGSRSGRRRSWR